jgi:two-component system cell cycle response regulator DivK
MNFSSYCKKEGIMNEMKSADKKNLIMVVDDSEDMCSLLEQILESAGYRVIITQDGQAALTQARLHHPDLILMDLSLPGMSGWEVVEHLRKMSEFRNTPVIAVTAHVTKYEQERARDAGCSAHIGKPFDSGILLRSIARLIVEG